MEIVAAESTNLFIGTEAAPRQVVKVVVRGTDADGSEPGRVRIEGARVRGGEAIAVGPLGPGQLARLEVGITVDSGVTAGEELDAEVVVEGGGGGATRTPVRIAVAEPGWRMFMISHFHYDPVWWNTQAAYTETWGAVMAYRSMYQGPGLALVKSHLEMARREPDYKFVLAELDYLKPYWDAYPEDRDYIRELLATDRLEFVGGTYNEPNTNLTSAESTVRNAIYGVAYQRDVLGGRPATAWQLDAFGHDPQFPGIMADAGVSSSSWARGPFHEWGPNWVRGPGRAGFAELATGEHPRMQFPMEFDWIAPSGRSLLTSFMADHYSAGWWMDAAPTLEDAETEVYRLFTELASVAATKNVLLPVGTDYTPPNRWLTAITHDWNARYVWPKFFPAIPREFFDAVRAEQKAAGRLFSPQTRDMNPIYTGKDVSFIDTKQAQRVAENTLLAAEKFATIAWQLGARFPSEPIDKAWRQLLFGAHHDGITGSESDQVYLDLLAGWRESAELGATVLDGALGFLGDRIDTAGDGRALVVFNALSWPRTDIVRTTIDLSDGAAGIEIRDDAGGTVPFSVEAIEAGDGRATRATVAFLAKDVPSVGYRTFRVLDGSGSIGDAAWRAVDGTSVQNETYTVRVDPARGGALESVVDRRTGKELVQAGAVANDLRSYREYPNHPLFQEGPWHLTPDGRFTSATDVAAASVTVESSPTGRRIRIESEVDTVHVTQEIRLWDGIDRVELSTTLHDYHGHDRLFRVRFPATVEGGAAVSETGNAVVGRPFGRPNVDVAKVPFTLDHPAYNWFALGATARVVLGPSAAQARAARAISVAEVVTSDDPAQDQAVRDLVVALVRQGVTSTSSRHDGHRYGVLHIDSNLPDMRVAIGTPDENRFVAAVLDSADRGYRDELDRQLGAQGWARVWVPEGEDSLAHAQPVPDLRAPRALPVLIVAGKDTAATTAALAAVTDDLGDSAIVVDQPDALDGATGSIEDYTIAVLNRGMPGFNVESDGNLYLSLMRSCSGWPSGVWIDPPRRSTPDGANFQMQHWTHRFEYALASATGDWREAATVRTGHEYNNPLIARLADPHEGALPATTGFVEVEPASAVLTVLKPAGNPAAHQASLELDPGRGVALRIYESSGRPTTATVRSRWAFLSASSTNALEETSADLSANGQSLEVGLQPYEIATVAASIAAPAERDGRSTEIGPRGEAAQPVFADYWLHNRGAAPLGNQAVTVQIKPSALAGNGPFTIPVSVASERTDEATSGTVELVVPAGWAVSPSDRIFNLAPGAHLAFEAQVRPADGASPGRYFVAARITDDAGDSSEDVVTIDLEAGTDGRGPRAGDGERSATLAWAVQHALAVAGIEASPGIPVDFRGGAELSGEIEMDVALEEVAVSAGQRATLHATLRNTAAGEVHGEVQVISPLETWSSITPWTQGFAVAGGEQGVVTFDIAPPPDAVPGQYWALIKVMYFGRILYSDSVPVQIVASTGAQVRDMAGAR